MTSLKPYPVYKDSGVPWLRQIPVHCSLSPRRALFREKKVKNVGLSESQVLSLIPAAICACPAAIDSATFIPARQPPLRPSCTQP
jgi:hypothetical protein